MLVERVTMAKGGMPPRNKKNFRATKKGAGMTEAGVKVSNPSLRKYYKGML